MQVSHRGRDVRHQTIRRQTLAVSLRDDFYMRFARLTNAAEPLPVCLLLEEGGAKRRMMGRECEDCRGATPLIAERSDSDAIQLYLYVRTS